MYQFLFPTKILTFTAWQLENWLIHDPCSQRAQSIMGIQTDKNSYSLRQIQYGFAQNPKEEVSQRWGREAATFGLRFGRRAHMLGLVGGNPRQLKLGWGRLWYFPVVAWSQAACGALAKRSQDCVQDFNSAGSGHHVWSSGLRVGNDGSEINSTWWVVAVAF